MEEKLPEIVFIQKIFRVVNSGFVLPRRFAIRISGFLSWAYWLGEKEWPGTWSQFRNSRCISTVSARFTLPLLFIRKYPVCMQATYLVQWAYKTLCCYRPISLDEKLWTLMAVMLKYSQIYKLLLPWAVEQDKMEVSIPWPRTSVSNG